MDERLLSKDWRMNNLYSVSTKEVGETVKFVPNLAQQKIFQAIKEYNRLIILKSRQLGATTGICIWFLDDVLFNRNLNALSIFQAREYAVSAFDGKVRFAWDNFNKELRDFLGWTVDTERANQLKFGFGDKAFSSYAVATSGRSGTNHRAHISEYAKMCVDRPMDAREIITGTFPSVPQTGKIVVESTANGETGDFAELWEGALQGKNAFHPLFLNWRLDVGEISRAPKFNVLDMPVEFDEIRKKHNLSPQELNYYFSAWRTLKNDWPLLRQEYPITAEEAFIGSGEKLFDMEAIEEYLRYAEDGKKSGNTTIFSPKQEGRTYVIGADIAEGVGRDSSTAVVWEVDGPKPRVVAHYNSDRIAPEDFAYILKEFGHAYGSCVIAPERNNHGHAVISVLRRIYPEDMIYRDSDVSGVLRPESSKYGFHTNAANKPVILNALAQATRERSIGIPSKDLLLEMRICPRSESLRTLTSPGQTRHFDLLMAAAIGFHARQFALDRGMPGLQKTYVLQRSFDPYAPI